MGQSFRSPTKSGALWAQWQPADSQVPWPDMVDFFGRFGLRIFVGTADYRRIVAQSDGVPNAVYSTFHTLNDIVHRSETYTPEQVKKILPGAYFSKLIYHEDPTGKKWHTPMVFHYDGITEKFYQTKGYKKLTALGIAEIHQTPVIVISDQKTLPIEGLWKVKHDQALVDFLQQVSGGVCQEPTFGLEFHDYGQGLVPFLHKITLNPSTGTRTAYGPLYQQDLKTWSRYKDKKIIVDVPLEKVQDQKYYPIEYLETQELDTNIRSIQPLFRKHSAAVVARGNPQILSRLLNALVWLSTEAQGQPVRAWFSRDRRYGVVFNNDSPIELQLPPGIINN